MALNFSEVSASFDQTSDSISENLSSVQSLTGRVNDGASKFREFSERVGVIDINARSIEQRINDTSETTNDVVDRISQISKQVETKVNQSLAAGEVAGEAIESGLATVRNAQGRLSESLSREGIERAIDSSASEVSRITTNFANNIRTATENLTTEAENTVEQVQQTADTSSFDISDFMNDTFVPLSKGANAPGSITNNGASQSKIPNPLREYNSYNYIITLGLLSKDEYNYPNIYRSRGNFKKYIVKSAGGDYTRRYKVNDEIDYDGDAEYYLDDLQIDAVVAPNPNTSVSLGTTISFNVIEPLSMGNFIQALIGAAKKEGFPNVVQAPFCLKIEFVGWDEYGNRDYNYSDKPIFIPINIFNMDFSVTGQGSSYQVQAVAYSEVALGDTVNTTRSTINANGTKVYEVLNGEDRSVSATLNQRIEELEDDEVFTKGDRYIIAFPDDLNSMQEAISGEAPGVPEPLTAPEQVKRQRGLSLDPEGMFPGIEETIQEVVVPPNSELYEIINSYALDTSRMNEIGLSDIIDEKNEGGDQATANQREVVDEESDSVDISNRESRVSEKAREHKFHQGEKINQIIEKVFLRSKYARKKATEESDANGTRQWFKIETRVYIDDAVTPSSDIGRPSRLYVYNVIPYLTDEAKYLATNEKAKNTEGLKSLAVKQYDYIYTGKNEDILEFDLSFNQAFLQTAMANFGNNPGASGSKADTAYGKDNDQQVSINKNRNGSGDNTEPGASVEEGNLNIPDNGSRSQSLEARIAEVFHNRLINQVTDLVTAEMKLFGDPYFLPQQTGNFFGKESPANPTITEDGTMNYMQNEVFIVVNFKTPFDYSVSGATMEFPKAVPHFSGLFSCWAVTNNFSQGKFEQTLKLIRRRGQDDESTTGNQGPQIIHVPGHVGPGNN